MADEKTYTKEEVQKILAQQMQNRGVPMPPSDGTGEFIKMRDEIVSLFFMAQQGILTPEEVRTEINKIKKSKGMSEITEEDWKKRFNRGENK